MPGRRKISTARLEVYKSAIAGNCQKAICQHLEKAKGTVSDHIAGLLSDGYLVEVSGDDQVKFYEKGPRAKVLDELLAGTSSEFQRGGRSDPTINSELSPITPNYSGLPLPPSCDVHSHGVRAMVNKIGDLDTWLEKCQDGLKGIEQWRGTVALDGVDYSVLYRESEATQWLYVWVQGTFTRAELEAGGIEEALAAAAQRVFNHVSKTHGWRFGIVETHRGSKTHYVPNSELVDQLAQEIPAEVLLTSGALHTDGTPERDDGAPTIEAKDPAAALGLLTPLAEIRDMKLAIKLMHQNQEILVQVVNTALVNQQLLSKVLETVGLGPAPPPSTGEEVV